MALERYLWSVTPCLMAWPAVMMVPGPGAFAVATTLGVVHAVDSSLSRRGLVPPWCAAAFFLFYRHSRSPKRVATGSGALSVWFWPAKLHA